MKVVSGRMVVTTMARSVVEPRRLSQAADSRRLTDGCDICRALAQLPLVLKLTLHMAIEIAEVPDSQSAVEISNRHRRAASWRDWRNEGHGQGIARVRIERNQAAAPLARIHFDARERGQVP